MNDQVGGYVPPAPAGGGGYDPFEGQDIAGGNAGGDGPDTNPFFYQTNPAYETVAAVPSAVSSAAPQQADQVNLQFTDSGLASTAAYGATGKMQRQEDEPLSPVGVPDFANQVPEGNAGPPPELATGPEAKPGMFSIKRFRKWFDVDTNEVLWRAGCSMAGPLRPDFFSEIKSNPDMYGPFWVTTTLIFITAVCGNYVSYAKATRQDEEQLWYYDANKVYVSALILYGYVFGLGGVFWTLLRWKGSKTVTLVASWCIYGYALTIYIPVALLCVINVLWLTWLLVAGATLSSGLFLISNFKSDIEESGVWAFTISACVGVAHAVLGLVIVLYFFEFS